MRRRPIGPSQKTRTHRSISIESVSNWSEAARVLRNEPVSSRKLRVSGLDEPGREEAFLEDHFITSVGVVVVARSNEIVGSYLGHGGSLGSWGIQEVLSEDG